MAIEDDSAIMLIGFVIVLVVGLNMVFFFGDLTGFGGSSNALTGAATVSCKDVADGIKCGTTTFASAENGCPYSTTKVCANNCQLSRLYANDNRICPTACTDVCVPMDIAEKL